MLIYMAVNSPTLNQWGLIGKKTSRCDSFWAIGHSVRQPTVRQSNAALIRSVKFSTKIGTERTFNTYLSGILPILMPPGIWFPVNAGQFSSISRDFFHCWNSDSFSLYLATLPSCRFSKASLTIFPKASRSFSGTSSSTSRVIFFSEASYTIIEKNRS